MVANKLKGDQKRREYIPSTVVVSPLLLARVRSLSTPCYTKKIVLALISTISPQRVGDLCRGEIGKYNLNYLAPSSPVSSFEEFSISDVVDPLSQSGPHLQQPLSPSPSLLTKSKLDVSSPITIWDRDTFFLALLSLRTIAPQLISLFSQTSALAPLRPPQLCRPALLHCLDVSNIPQVPNHQS
ncbi:hypothetical protein FCM35_KLT17335 [Carex littledalei]|uniref:Uncharacterized protein n=1 Tax=Carex littledalei TaxID=544730 RepID=A0A833RNH6_9POAL|nr:hypothetical protein FCM35_KLT17335 [Carex littledalei]